MEINNIHCIIILGCNEEVVIRIFTDHNNAQRQEIKNKYRSIFGKVGIPDNKTSRYESM